MPKLTIDGKEVEVEPGTTVIRAAEKAGIFIPRYCWHPGLTIAGNCRMCLVEIEKMPKLVISCSTQTADGMVVRTTSPKVKEAQDAILEFLLINHPLDCPICDQAGECKLQEFAYDYGPARSRFLEEKVHKPKAVNIGRNIVFDGERCIVCTRCVRFCQEVSKTGELTVAHRGDHVTIETFPGMALDNAYSGNTVDLCPVGALTLKQFRFQQRVWFLKDVPSVCAGCARGCNVLDGISKGRILRITPRENQDVNRWWICDEGRLSYEKLSHGGRIVWPRVADRLAARPIPESEMAAIATVAAAAGLEDRAGAHGRFAGAGGGSSAGGVASTAAAPEASAMLETPEEERPVLPRFNEGVPPAPRAGGPEKPGETVMAAALDAAARVLAEAKAAAEGSVEFVFSARATNEDLYVFGKMARELFGATRVALPAHERGEDDALLLRRDKTPNRRGALAIMGGLGLAVETGAELLLRVGSGSVRALVALGPNLMGLETEPIPGPHGVPGMDPADRGASPPVAGAPEFFGSLAAAAAGTGASIVAIDAFDSPLTRDAAVVLPALTYGEIEGTFTSFLGRVQRVRAGLAPGADGLPVFRIAQEIGRRLGAQPPPRHGAQETFSALAAEVHAFAGLSYAKVGEKGAMLAGAEAGTEAGAGPGTEASAQ